MKIKPNRPRFSVLALTPSPALDLSGTVNHLKPNEKSYVYDEIRSAGGNAVNAAKVLHRLNIPVLATGFLGGSTGKEIQQLLEEEGVPSDFIPIRGHSRICVTVSNRADHQQTRLTFPGPPILRREKEALFRLLGRERKNSFLMIGGSLPPGFSAEDLVRAMKTAEKNGIRCIVDVPGKILRKVARANPFFLKPNLDEFQALTGSTARTIRGVRRAAEPISRRVPLFCVSSVEGGALLINGDRCYFGRAPRVAIKSSVGAGDSMVAAMAAQLCRGNTDGADLLRWGLAAAAATLAEKGTASGSAKNIYRLYHKTRVRSL